ncbi:DUF4082 domain-containing protein [Rhodococcus aetherivorans]|uniref:DUF4082 domain-containing protein n=1 Tax=Rhodococcus aetherivorans TaxID=191292 RepID=UPI001E2C5334|nr:DUF4082 domain-containing protein [Rhodococcus aetherivorans]UGQ39990.1 DUF4082 domain-containing protein [Rhodococcus aetherivorans]
MLDKRPTARSLVAPLLVAVMVLTGSCTQGSPDTAERPGSPAGSLWSDETVPAVSGDPAARPIEVGTEFTTTSDGVVTAARFYQGPEDTGAVTATLWSSDGTALGTVPITTGPSGWRNVPFDEPIPIQAHGSYVISYRASNGNYPTDPNTFDLGATVKSGWLTARDGRFTYGEGIPDQSGNGAAYFVDVVFEPTGPSLRSVDGGEEYYDTFENSLPTSPDYFPLAVWFARVTSPEEAAVDRTIGLNTYVELTEDSDVRVIRDSGMFALPSRPDPLASGQLTTDEADMWAGAGDAPWTGRMPDDRPICVPEQAKCGYTVMYAFRSKVPSGVMTFTNYGKGVTFWEPRDAAERFVNDFQDVVSADNYWFTDDTICQADQGGVLTKDGQADLSPAECHLAANYGVTTRYVRSLVQPRAAMPVWNFVEVGHPFEEDTGGTITGPQIRAAVWSSIINGARGIVYFSHNFGGPCLSYNIFRDRCGDGIRDDVRAVNDQINRLAPVLNAPFVDGFARSDGPVDLAAKYHEGSLYVLAGSTRNEGGDATIALACGNADQVEVLDEGRSLPVTGNTFRDTFDDGNAVHLYRIDRTADCDLQ